MELIEAIYHRRSVRAYTDQKVDKATVETLINAAVQAPSSMNQQPWAFAVIQNANILARYSDAIKSHLLKTMKPQSPLTKYREQLAHADFNVFYGVDTLILICAKKKGHHVEEDCSLAAQNLMLAAYGLGLGTCPIGFARPWLNLAKTKRELGIPAGYKAVFPVIVGIPRGETAPVGRREPEILFWNE
jgi:nitroreductase